MTVWDVKWYRRGGYAVRRPKLPASLYDWTDAQFTRVKQFFAVLRHLKENPMERVFTLELRVDHSDTKMFELYHSIIAEAARKVYGASALLKENIKPQVAIFSDDFFQTHEEINLAEGSEQEHFFREELLQVDSDRQGKTSEGVSVPEGDESPFSPELLEAFR